MYVESLATQGLNYFNIHIILITRGVTLLFVYVISAHLLKYYCLIWLFTLWYWRLVSVRNVITTYYKTEVFFITMQ